MFYFQAKPTITVGTKKVTKEATKEKFNSIFVQSHRMFSFFSNCATTVQFVGPLCSILVVAKPGVSSKRDAITKSLSRFFFSFTHAPSNYFSCEQRQKSQQLGIVAENGLHFYSL